MFLRYMCIHTCMSLQMQHCTLFTNETDWYGSWVKYLPTSAWRDVLHDHAVWGAQRRQHSTHHTPTDHLSSSNQHKNYPQSHIYVRPTTLARPLALYSGLATHTPIHFPRSLQAVMLRKMTPVTLNFNPRSDVAVTNTHTQTQVERSNGSMETNWSMWSTKTHTHWMTLFHTLTARSAKSYTIIKLCISKNSYISYRQICGVTIDLY